VRQLRHSPGSAATAIVTLGFGIGTAVTKSSVSSRVVLPPVMVEEPETLVSQLATLPRGGTMRKNVYSLILIAFVTSLLWVASAGAQQGAGAVSGRATDPDHRALQGARIELAPKGLTAVSDNLGRFTIPGVPAGDYTLIVLYLGLSPFSAPVTVRAGQVTQVEASLAMAPVTEEIMVHGDRASGEVQALNRIRAADTIMSVLPAEVITSLPNTNIADALGRMPGVSLERDEGEGKYVQIRGTEPRLSNMTINGVHVSSPEQDVRNVKLDVIPADLVESIEVSKTLSANQDGDAIGGSINLVTKTADDVPYFSVTGLSGYSPIASGRWRSQVGAVVSKRFGKEKRLGVAFGGSYDYNGRGINNSTPKSPGTKDFGDGLGPVPVLTGLNLREYNYRRQRYGFAGSLDYRLSNGSSAYIRGLFSEFKDFGDTWDVNQKLGKLLTPTTSASTGSVVIRHLDRTPQQRIYSLTGGEKLNLGQYLLDYQVAVSRERSDGQFPMTYFNGSKKVAFGIDTSNPMIPKLPVLNGVDINDPAAYTLAKTISADDHARELDLEGSISLARHYVVGSRFGSFEVGAKIRNGDKQNSTYEPVNVATGTPVLQYSQVLGSVTDPNFFFSSYTLPPLSDYSKIEALLAANPGAVSLDVDQTRSRSDPNSYHTKERVYATYAMNTFNTGRVRLQTGVRIEATHSHFIGNHVTFDSNGHYVSTTPVAGDNSYVDVLPSVQFQYAFSQNGNVRAGYGRGLARPNFADLPPYILQSDLDQQLTVGNPALKPTHANNFDLLFEQYLKPVGLVQAGVFYKALSDPIFSVQSLITTGQYAGYLQIQPTNGTTAHIFGFEMGYQQHLTFLPGFLRGMGVSANYSHTSSAAVVPNRSDDPTLIRQGPNNWNMSLTYDRKGLSARFGVTHNDAYIYLYRFQTGAALDVKGPNGDQYTFAHTQMDAQGTYSLKGGFSLVVSLLNINNEVFGFFYGSPQYPSQLEYYGRTLTIGVRLASSAK